MFAPSVLAASLALFSSLAAAANKCEAEPYGSLACLSSNSAAATVCALAPRSTTTITVTTTTLDKQTATTSQNAAVQKTIQSTNTESTTKTVTAGSTTTITTTLTDLTTETTTSPTYVPATCLAPACKPTLALDALNLFTAGNLASACSCIGHPPPLETSTSIVTAADVPVTSTSVAGRAATTTELFLTRITYTTTVAPRAFATETTTACTTSTITTSLAAPTFSQVYGPTPGCKNIAAAPGPVLDAEIDNMGNATAECRGLCVQDSACSFVFVQELVAGHYEGAASYFQCLFGERKFNATADMECGKDKGVFGQAVGHDACGRGVMEEKKEGGGLLGGLLGKI